MTAIHIPQQLLDAVDEDDYAERYEWLAALPRVVTEIASDWALELGEPYIPGGQCAWVAPARTPAGDDLVLKVGWRHREAEHEADALRFWDDNGAVRCPAARSLEDTETAPSTAPPLDHSMTPRRCCSNAVFPAPSCARLPSPSRTSWWRA